MGVSAELEDRVESCEYAGAVVCVPSVSIVVKEVDDCWEGTGVTILATW